MICLRWFIHTSSITFISFWPFLSIMLFFSFPDKQTFPRLLCHSGRKKYFFLLYCGNRSLLSCSTIHFPEIDILIFPFIHAIFPYHFCQFIDFRSVGGDLKIYNKGEPVYKAPPSH